GGLLGGISNGEEIRIRVAVKPTPTILQEQATVDVGRMEDTSNVFASRSDPTICTRVYPVCEAMVRMAILDAMYMTFGYKGISTEVDSKWERI
ncbi:MAG: chorismate synthase, partial [Clostridiales bacterium]|nr:chorismate synthase [Clostridiales bacterium]